MNWQIEIDEAMFLGGLARRARSNAASHQPAVHTERLMELGTLILVMPP